MKTETINGNIIYFRPPKKNELSFIKHMWEDSATMKEVGGPISMSDEQYQQWFQKIISSDNDGYYCLIFDSNDTPIGEVSYRLIDKENIIGAQNIKILADHRKKGYAKDALLSFLDYAFNTLGLNIMTDEIAIDNKVSHKFFLDLGFKHYPEKSEHFWVEINKNTFNSLHSKSK